MAVAETELAQLAFYHSIDVAPGVATKGWFDLRHALPLMPFPEVEGRRCLDVGTWDGFYAYELERRGASEVIAVDLPDIASCDFPPEARADPSYDPDPPGQQHRSAGFDLLHRLLESRVDWRPVNIYDVAGAGLGQFDLVVVGSLLVHLRDPVRALDEVRQVTRGHLLLVEYLHTPLQVRSRRRPLTELRGVGTDFQWWLPNDAALRQMLHVAGFSVERVSRPFLLRLCLPPPRPGTAAALAKQAANRAANAVLTGDWRHRGHLHRAYLARPRL